MTERVWMAVANVADGTGYVIEVVGEAFPAEGGWTYQGVLGGGTLLLESEDEALACAALAKWLDAAPKRSERDIGDV